MSTPYNILPAPHLIGTLSLFAVLGLAEGMVKPALAGSFDCVPSAQGPWCDAQRLWRLDRTVLGYHSAAWRHISDLGNVAVLGGAVAASFADSSTSGSRTALYDAGVDTLVMAESVGVATFITHVLKYAIRRPRPSMYQSTGARGVESQLSFPSGHTTVAAAACAAYATTFVLRHPLGWPKYGVAAAGLALTTLTAAGRINGGMHFYTDVVAGALVGGATGFLLPMALRRRVDVRVTVARDAALGSAAQAYVVWHL